MVLFIMLFIGLFTGLFIDEKRGYIVHPINYLVELLKNKKKYCYQLSSKICKTIQMRNE